MHKSETTRYSVKRQLIYRLFVLHRNVEHIIDEILPRQVLRLDTDTDYKKIISFKIKVNVNQQSKTHNIRSNCVESINIKRGCKFG